MKKVAVAFALALATIAPTAYGNPDAIDGTWKVVAWKHGAARESLPPGVSLLLHFDKSDWKWSADVSHAGRTKHETGSWTFERNAIVMRQAERARRVVVSASGDTLTMASEDEPAVRLIAIRAAK